MTTLAEAIHAFKGEMRRAQFRPSSQDSYRRQLERFAEHVGEDTPVSEVTPSVIRGFLDTFDRHAPATVALMCTVLSSLFKFLVLDDVVDVNPMDKVRRPKVPAARDRVRTRITTEQVQQMLTECHTWPERLCLNTLAHTGVRRTALSNARWRDLDGKRWLLTFHEKGNKRISKPVPLELQKLYKQYALEQGASLSADDWVVPNKRDTGRRDKRSNKIVYSLVKDVAERCGIKSHVHAFRAAFAVHFLRSNPANIESLRQLMGHSSIATTQGYLDELEGEAAMRTVESLSYQIGAAA